MDDLNEIIAANAEKRAQALRDQDADEQAAADLADQVRHHGETDEERAARRHRQAERDRLRALGVRFSDG